MWTFSLRQTAICVAQVDPSIFAADDIKALRGLAWLLVKHKASFDAAEINGGEILKKRRRTQVGHALDLNLWKRQAMQDSLS